MGVIDPVEVTLRDGARLRLFSPVESDAERALEFFRRVTRTTDNILSAPEDADALTIDDERRMIETARENPCGLVIVAEPADGGPIVAMCDIRPYRHVRARHGVVLGISVAEAWRGRGLGRIMMQRVIDWAREHPTIERITLGVLADSPDAQRLYRSFGFVETGRLPGFIRMADGRLRDEISMSLYLKEPPRTVPGEVPPLVSADFVRRVVEHERWATERLFDAIETVPQDRRTEPGYQRAIDKVAHILAARALWLNRMGASLPVPDAVFPVGWSIADTRAQFEQIQSVWEQWGGILTDADLSAPLHYSSMDGTQWMNTRADIVLHVCTHGFLHRGQANTLLAQAGGTPVNMDMIFFLRQSLS